MTEREVIVPLTEPVSIEKALLGGREARVSTSVQGSSAAFLVNIQLTGWNNTKEYNEGYACGFNNAAEWMQKAIARNTARVEQAARATPADHSDDALNVAIALERVRALEIVAAVRADGFSKSPTKIPTQAESVFDLACEEIDHRLRNETWALNGVSAAPQPEAQSVRDAEPIAWMLEVPAQSTRWYTSGRHAMEHWVKGGAVATPLYAAPQAAEKRPVVMPEGYIELNMNNYDSDDVSRLNEWAIEAYGVLESLKSAPPQKQVSDEVKP